jgi:hypothetical protein
MRIVNHGFERFERQVPDLPSEPTLGSRQNVLLAALTLSFLEALEAEGIERGYAIELTGDVCWRFYRQSPLAWATNPASAEPSPASVMLSVGWSLRSWATARSARSKPLRCSATPTQSRCGGANRRGKRSTACSGSGGASGAAWGVVLCGASWARIAARVGARARAW